MANKPPIILRFGIMTHGMVLSSWQYDCIRLLVSSGIAKAELIINDASVSNRTTSLGNKIQNYTSKNALYKLYHRFLLKIPAYEHIVIDDVLNDVDKIDCTTIKKGKYSEYFSDSDLEQIRSYDLDFILRFGFNIIRGSILEVPKYGVWSYHHGNELKFRGGPAGFWEIFQNSTTNGVVLQKLNDLIDAGVIINRRAFQTVQHSYSEHLNKLLTESVDMPLQVCRQIASGDHSHFEKEHSSSKARINRLPNNWQMFRFYLKLIGNRINFHIDRLTKQEHWDIGIVEASNTEIPESSNFKNINWLGLRKGSQYAADSFCFESNNANYIVFEDYDYRSQKGIISFVKLDSNNNSIHSKKVLEKPFHIAYPYIFKDEHSIYLIPETAENGTIELYIWDEKNEEFVFQQVLLNVSGVDSSVVHYLDRWWLFCGIKNELPNEKLHIYYADNLTGEYMPHLLNPVKTNPSGSRPAGQTIIKNNVLYRPAQQSVNWYGEKIVWYKVNDLTPSAFSEEQVGEIAPFYNWEYNKGVHTFSQTSKIMVIDAKKRSSGWIAFKTALGS